MRELNVREVSAVSGAYGDNAVANIMEGIYCSVGAAIIGSWTLAIAGGRGAFSGDVIGIGGGLTALAGMVGGAALGAVAGAIAGPFIGYEKGLVMAEEMLRDLMRGKPGL